MRRGAVLALVGLILIGLLRTFSHGNRVHGGDGEAPEEERRAADPAGSAEAAHLALRGANIPHDTELSDAALGRDNELSATALDMELDSRDAGARGGAEPRTKKSAAPGVWDGWIPIEIAYGNGAQAGLDRVTVSMCRLDFALQHADPSKVPMFRNLVEKSRCAGNNLRRATLAELKRDISAHPSSVIAPNGFVFHEARCGSTLVANMLASDPSNLLYSESKPPPLVALHCPHCTRAQKIEYLRVLVAQMGRGRATGHSKLFFKFQSVMVLHMDLLLEAFPSVPWAFVHRNPVEIMVSMMKHGGGHAPCTRRQRDPPQPMRAFLSKQHAEPGAAGRLPHEQYCAAHLATMCGLALKASQGSADEQGSAARRARGRFVEYSGLVATMLDDVFPRHFGLLREADAAANARTRATMKAVTAVYSKGRDDKRVFKDDSAEKQKMASAAIRKWAAAYVDPVYQRMKKADQAVSQVEASRLREVRSGRDARGSASVGSGGLGGASPAAGALAAAAAGAAAAVAVAGAAAAAAGSSAGGAATGTIPSSTDTGGVPLQTCLRLARDGPRIDQHYPVWTPTRALFKNWPADNHDYPKRVSNGLCRFDFRVKEQRDAALEFRKSEVPFVATHAQDVEKVVKLWTWDYLEKKFEHTERRTELSDSNHFMYWQHQVSWERKHVGAWKPPTGIDNMKLEDWRKKANDPHNHGIDNPHYYFFTASQRDAWIEQDLEIFRQHKKTFWIVNPNHYRGIHCRFGMPGIIAEAHFDGGRNMIAVLKGHKRYVLMAPKQCKNIYLLLKGHPSGRHSEVDWSDVDEAKFPKFFDSEATETIVSEGEVLYVPSHWIHYPISLDVSVQCNCRSGNVQKHLKDVQKCGFYPSRKGSWRRGEDA